MVDCFPKFRNNFRTHELMIENLEVAQNSYQEIDLNRRKKEGIFECCYLMRSRSKMLTLPLTKYSFVNFTYSALI